MEASWYELREGNRTACLLCPQGCVPADGQAGLCLGRVNHGGTLTAETWARPATVGMDPVEKKPLYHFHPGSAVLSMGTYGCNLRCAFCQNRSLSQNVVPVEEITPENAVRLLRARGGVGVAYTYNEPVVWLEYVRDCGAAVREAGFENVLVTNGYVNEAPLAEVLPVVDAMNIDLKAFNDEFYREVCGASLDPVLRTIETAAAVCHVEITNLVIPGYNDDPAEQEAMAAWIAEHAGPETPVHLSAYFPRHELRAEATTLEQLVEARKRFLAHCRHVYLGNVASGQVGDTRCAQCGATVVSRSGYAADTTGMNNDGTCAACGADNNIVP